jgi:hypothetical protein
MDWTGITRRFTDSRSAGSASGRARARRWAECLANFPDLARMNVLDLGGTASYWGSAPVRPEHVTLVNISPGTSQEAWLTEVGGDACSFQSSSHFDLVISNSLLEHLGGPARRQQFADVVQQAADRHWVQTPYRYFPIEPHWLFPGLQWLPVPARVMVTRHWPLGHCQADTHDEALRLVLEVELVGRTEMAKLFPTSRLWSETWLGLTKSLVAIRS